jgi:outer membrane immunogenic protein
VKKLLLATTALTPFFLAVGSADAADLPVKAPAPVPVAALPNWTGFYMGLNAGGAWGRADPNTSTSCVASPGFGLPYIGMTGSCADVPLVNAAGTGSISKAAFIGGGQAGYNVQSNNVVYGIELDFDSMNIKAARQATGTYATLFPNTFTVTSSAGTNWLFTTRGRVGWAFGDVLAYATGGLAVTELKSSNSFTDSLVGFPGPGVGTWSTSATKLGWTAGGGIEWALNRNWSAKVEYLYVKFGSVTASGLVIGSAAIPGVSYGNAINTSVDLAASIARAGINYKF